MASRTGSGWHGRIGVSALVLFAATSSSRLTLKTVVVATGLSEPVFTVSLPGDSSKLLVLERSGTIRLFRDGIPDVSLPFLDLSAKVGSGGERGLFSLAFHPQAAANGYFYVCYARLGDGALVVERYTMDPSGLLAWPASAFPILAIPAPTEFHHGGNLAFGPFDGLLYLGVGDGKDGGDPDNSAQNVNSLRGKILRIDVDAPAGGMHYGIPPSNPFAGAIPGADEIWALGVRNPWRFSFDSRTGDLWIGDVGEGTVEEIDLLPFGAPAGANLGWHCMEGNTCHPFLTSATCTCSAPTLTPPVFTYQHSEGCAVMGGALYRGSAIPFLEGAYFFADFCTSKIFSFRYAGGAVTDLVERTTELEIPIGTHSPCAFGTDADGEIYIVYLSGQVLKIVSDGGPPVGRSGSVWVGGSGGGAAGCLQNLR